MAAAALVLLPVLGAHAQDGTAQPTGPGGSGANQQASKGGPSQEEGTPAGPELHEHVDPFLKYAENVELRVSQVELSGFPVVRAFTTATDENGILIRTLRAGDFTVEENGVPVGEVRFANRDELDLPLAIQFVVDISGSMGIEVDAHGTTALDLEIEAIKQFITELAPRDRVGLITFSDAAIRDVHLTTDHSKLLRSLERMTAWGQTTLWDGIYVGVQELLSDTQPARRALIVLSDGMDNKSLETPHTILQFYDEKARRENKGFSVYSLGLGDEIDRGALGNLATQTGGIYLDSPGAQDLADVYSDILSQIQSEYLLEYDAPEASQPGQIIDVSVGIKSVQSFTPGTYTYRSPGLTEALARALWPGLIAVLAALAVLIIATIYRISRRVWLTVMLTPLEGKDYAIGMAGVGIGSTEACEVRLPGDPAMMPLHASISETADGYLLEAVDPHSPIITAGSRLVKKLLRSGDRFALGSTSFVFHEKVIRPGEGREELAGHYIAEAPVPLTEEAQTAARQDGGDAAAAVASRKVPTAIIAVSGPHAGERYGLSEGENLIGRTEGAIMLGGDSQVSRRHCTITLSGGVATLVDPGSSNGTRLGGKPCQPGMAQTVYAGDVLTIGAGDYRLE